MLNPREENRKNGVTTPYSEQLSPTVNCCLLTFTICSLSLSNVESGRVEQKEWVTTLCIQQLSPTHCDCRSTWRFSWEGGRRQICQQQVEEDGMHELSIGHQVSRCQLGDSSIAEIIQHWIVNTLFVKPNITKSQFKHSASQPPITSSCARTSPPS